MAGAAYFQRLLLIATAIAAGLLPTLALAAEPASLQGFSASYKVRYGILGGKMTLELRRHGDDYVYETSLQPSGFVSWLRRGEIRERTTLRVLGGAVQPLDYTNNDTIARPPRFAGYVFGEDVGRVTGEYKSRAVDEAMRPGGQNRISAQVAIFHALQTEKEISGLAVFDRARWRDFEFEFLPGQVVQTPAGKFDTVEVRYASADKEKSWSLYCAYDLGYLPVLIEFREDGKTKSRAELSKYRLDENRGLTPIS